MPTVLEVRKIAYLARAYGLRVPTEPVCCGHTAPGEFLAMWYYDRPAMSLVHGPRGGGKSMLKGFDSKLKSERFPKLQTRILGGSMAQSEQIYNALKHFQQACPDLDQIDVLTKLKATFLNGSEVAVLSASTKQVHGPHVQELCLDEIDEIDEDVREGSIPMAMAINGIPASISMTSTWHRIAGPMAELIKRGQEGAFPVKTFCAFEILERCPESRSGPATGDERAYEACPACPILKWCHADIETTGGPKAKRSSGHYAIGDLISKAAVMSPRRFESDLLCMRPRAAGMWFSQFDHTLHVQESAEYDRNVPVHCSIDTGVYTFAVWFQVKRSWDNTAVKVNVFGEYFAEDISAEQNGRAIIARAIELTGVGVGQGKVSTDSAAKQKTAVGPTVRGELQRAGCVGRDGVLFPWPAIGQGRPKADTLALVEALLCNAFGEVSLTIHPRCVRLIEAFETYVRKKGSDGNFMDEPADPQHPAEDAIDAIAGGLVQEFPSGRLPAPVFRTVDARSFL